MTKKCILFLMMLLITVLLYSEDNLSSTKMGIGFSGGISWYTSSPFIFMESEQYTDAEYDIISSTLPDRGRPFFPYGITFESSNNKNVTFLFGVDLLQWSTSGYVWLLPSTGLKYYFSEAFNGPYISGVVQYSLYWRGVENESDEVSVRSSVSQNDIFLGVGYTYKLSKNIILSLQGSIPAISAFKDNGVSTNFSANISFGSF